MKINNKLNGAIYDFGNIKVGECFMFNQKLYLKLQNNNGERGILLIR